MDESLTPKGSYDRRELFIITPEPTILTQLIFARVSPPNLRQDVQSQITQMQNMYLQSTTQWLCLETQEDYHPHVRTGVQLKHKA